MAATQTLQSYASGQRGSIQSYEPDAAPVTTSTLQVHDPSDQRGSVMTHTPTENSVALVHRKPVLSTPPRAGVPSVDLSDTDDVRPRPVD